MDFRVLQYFLAVTKEQSISAAARALHLSQPTLSRQLKDLENELGISLFIRGARKITLTEEGQLLKKRATEILILMDKTQHELSLTHKELSGDIYIGAGETHTMKLLTLAAQKLNTLYPNIHYHFISDDESDVKENLEKGIIDFGVIFGIINKEKYNFLPIPLKDHWGVLMRWDCLLSKKTYISPEDLWDKPLILSRQALNNGELNNWFQTSPDSLNIVGTYNLLYNGSLLVEGGLGYALCFDNIINITEKSNFIFRPLRPPVESSMNIIWKKDRPLSKISEKYLDILSEMVKNIK